MSFGDKRLDDALDNHLTTDPANDGMVIEHWECAVCNKQLTFEKDEFEYGHHQHIDIQRSNKNLIEEDGEIYVDDVNVKMERQVCENCFLKILHESPTLGKLFLDKEKNAFRY